MANRKWYQRTPIQVAIVTGVFAVIAAIVTVVGTGVFQDSGGTIQPPDVTDIEEGTETGTGTDPGSGVEEPTDTVELPVETVQQVHWERIGGEWDFSADRIRARGDEGFNKAYLAGSACSDFTFKVKVRKTEEEGPLGVLYRYTEVSDLGYALLLWPNGTYQVSVLTGDTRKSIDHGSAEEMRDRLSTWNDLSVECEQETCHVYLNNVHLTSVNDTTLAEGGLGLCLHGGHNQVAEFEVVSRETY